MNTSHRISTLLLILWMKLSPHEHCISQTPSDPPVNSICIGTGGSYKDFLTLGQQILVTSLAGGGDGFSMPGNSVASGNTYAPTDTLFLEIWAMKRKNSDHFLSGWLYIRALTGPGNSDKRLFNRVMYTQMEDENGNAVGEFESTEYCHTDPPYGKWNPDDYFAPCGQVAPSAAKVSNAMMFTSWNLVVNSQEREVLKQFYDSNLYHFGPSVYFKFSHTSCNKPEKIRLRAYVRSTPRTYSDRIYSYGTLRTNWMKINWTGAADILQVGEKAECYSKLVYIFPGQVQDVTGLPWIERVEPTIPVKEETSNQDIYRTKKFCKAVRFKIGEDHRHVPTFAGRCMKHDEYNASRKYKHDCKAGATADYKNFRNESFMKYSEYLKKRMSCMKISRCPCQCRVGRIDNMSGLANPVCPGSYFDDSNKTTNEFELGVPVNTTAGMSILEARKKHGVAMLIVTMVFVPFNILISRYFKETWLKEAQLKKVQVWYLVHLVVPYMTICLYLFASVSLRRSKNLLGESLLGSDHRIIGWTTLALFILATATGPFRPVSSPNLKTRKFMMIGHALLGIIYYSLGSIIIKTISSNMAAVITSSWIPGSPTSSELICLPSPLYFESSSHAIMPRVITWIVMDLGFHLIYMLLLRWADGNLNIRRSMYLPLISVLKWGGHHDMKGFRYRKLFLIIYSICNGGIVFDLMLTIITAAKAGCGYGPTTCTNTTGGGFLLLNSSSCNSF